MQASRRLLAGERHNTVQPLVLLSPRPEYFNLDAKSEDAGNVREAWQTHVPSALGRFYLGDPGGRGRTPPIYYEPTKHTAGVEQAERRGLAYGTHTQGGKAK